MRSQRQYGRLWIAGAFLGSAILAASVPFLLERSNFNSAIRRAETLEVRFRARDQLIVLYDTNGNGVIDGPEIEALGQDIYVTDQATARILKYDAHGNIEPGFYPVKER